MNALELKNISIGLKNTDDLLVSDVSFKVKKGQTVGIVGESGSGKTLANMSILKLLHNALEVKSGQILLTEDAKTTNILDLTDQELNKIRGNKISVIFQEPLSSLNPSIKVGKQIAEMLLCHCKWRNNELKTKTISLIDEVGMSDAEIVYNKYPFQLSGGQQQRLMIAMAIANNPDYIIADEPTTALDVLVQKRIIGILKALQQKYGMGLIFISHDIELVGNISDIIVIMNKGSVVEKGIAKEVLKFPKKPYTIKLLRSRPHISQNTYQPVTIPKEEKLLEFKNVSLYYPSGKSFFGRPKPMAMAVKNISFAVYPGETLGIVGGSGSGKSTLGKSLVNLIENINGEIWYSGNKISDLPNNQFKEYRKKIQLVFQDPFGSLNPKLTIGSALLEVLKFENPKNNKNGVLELLEQVKLPHSFFNRYPHELSGGQRQRIVIARALALKPELLICDESVSALDVSIQADILQLLNEIKDQQNLTMLFISHDLNIVKFMSQRILVLKEGVLEELAYPVNLFSNPQSDYTKELLKAMYTLD